jgi:LuxR family transcriptional regulator of csgAB operon
MLESTERYIHIVGGINLQNRLLASFLEEETGAKCLTVNGLIESRAAGEKRTNDQKVALLDCSGKNRGDVFHDFQLNGNALSYQSLLGLFNMRSDLEIEEDAIASGVRGFFYENDQPEQIARGVLAIFGGELWVSRKIMSRVVSRCGTREFLSEDLEVMLTAREKDILTMIAAGMSNNEIGDQLFISTHTVKSHLYNVFKKIRVSSRFQAALWAVKNLRMRSPTL